jgi:hypothetical protein
MLFRYINSFFRKAIQECINDIFLKKRISEKNEELQEAQEGTKKLQDAAIFQQKQFSIEMERFKSHIRCMKTQFESIQKSISHKYLRSFDGIFNKLSLITDKISNFKVIR